MLRCSHGYTQVESIFIQYFSCSKEIPVRIYSLQYNYKFSYNSDTVTGMLRETCWWQGTNFCTDLWL